MDTPSDEAGPSSHKTTPNRKSGSIAVIVKNKRSKDKDLERKRERGEVSCAECKRLKLKCNKKIPCSSCVRRGCHTICPNGSLSSGHGTRFVLANTDKLHTKLLDMSKRIRQLEDALHIAHTSISPNSHPHPLLTDELLSIKSGVDLPEEEEPVDEVPELAVSLGTLAISHGGKSLFVGNVGSEALLMDRCGKATNVNLPDNSLAEVLASLPEELKHLAEGFPFASSSWSKEEMRKLIKSHLPTYERATSLAEAYLENISWFCRPVQREQIMQVLIPSLYKREWVDESEDIPESEESPEMHQLALSLALFSCGAVVDLTLPPYNAEGVIYNHLAKAALSLKSVFEGSSFETVQTIILLSNFEFFVSRKSSLESAWKLMSFGLVLASSIGLHRDPARWNLDARAIRWRRQLFWEIFPIDKWKSMGSGRPAIFHLDEIDCRPPDETDEYDDGTRDATFRAWKHRYTKEILAPTAEYMGKVRPVKYSDILEYDRKIREFPEYPEMKFDDSVPMSYNPRKLMWRRYKEILLLFLHRNFFAKAMIDEPVNPLRSSFAPSFLAAYSTSITYLKSSRAAYESCPPFFDRQWTFWAHALVAAVMIGSVACRTAPSLASLTTAAREEMIASLEMFEKVAGHPVVAAGLPIIIRLRNKALLLKRQQELGYPRSVDLKIEDDEAYDELIILKGTARTVQPAADGNSKGSKDTSPEPNASISSRSPASSVTAGPETPGMFTTPAAGSGVPVRASSPSIFSSNTPPASTPQLSIVSAPWASGANANANAQQQDHNKPRVKHADLDDWALWVESKLNQPGLAADLADEAPSPAGQWTSDNRGVNNSSGVAPPTTTAALNGLFASAAQPLPLLQLQPQSQQVQQVQAMNPDAWQELGFRTVMESLSCNAPGAQPSAPFVSGTAFPSQPPASSPLGNFNSASQNSNTVGGYPGAGLPADIAAMYGFTNFTSPNVLEQTQTQSQGAAGGQSNSTLAEFDGMLMDSGDASLMDAWRTMTDFPDFMGIETSGFM